MSESSKTCWIVTEGIAGTENPCIGLAEAMGLSFSVKKIKLRSPWRQLSPFLRVGQNHALAPDSDRLDPPYPDVLISSGRKAVALGMHIRKKSGGKTFLVHVQDPRVALDNFDLVIAPQHDPARGANVLVSRAGLHRITPEKLAEAGAKFTPVLSHLPYPRVAVLIGGNSKAHRMTPDVTQRLARQLQALSQSAGLMITASRRTGPENEALLRQRVTGPNVWFWDGSGENPYFGFLALADYIIVTEDSVSMASEALSTGKPVYIAALEGGARRLNLFHSMLREQGYTRPFTGRLEQWSYTPPNDTQQIASEILKRMREK